MKYALITNIEKGSQIPKIVIWDSTQKGLYEKANELYWKQRSRKPAGSIFTKDDFFDQYSQVKITMELI